MPKRTLLPSLNEDPYVRHQLSSLQKLFTGLLFPAGILPETAAQMIGVHPDIMPYLHEKGLLKALEPKEPKKSEPLPYRGNPGEDPGSPVDG